MKTQLFRSFASLTLVGLILSFCTSAMARPRPSTQDLLVQAYSALANANHDYEGHRLAAMQHIQKAGDFLGVKIRGDEKRYEPQVVSDDQLRIAHRLLRDARRGLKGRPREQVEKALDQVETALRVK